MTENILKALTQLFGLITKQDGGATKEEREFIIAYFKKDLDQDSVDTYTKLYDEVSEYGKENVNTTGEMPMKESVRVLRFCKEINKSLEQSQRVIILLKLLELVAYDKKYTPRRREVIETVASVFKIKDDYSVVENFAFSENSKNLNHPNILVAGNDNSLINPDTKYLEVPNLDGELIFLWVKSVDLFFVKYIGTDDVRLNGFAIKSGAISLFPNGSSIGIKQRAIYYGDVTSRFHSTFQDSKLSFTAKNLQFKFPNGTVGIQNTSISEPQGRLIGIMGGSGAGKTTLMNVLAGLEDPSKGKVLINGVDIHETPEKIDGVIGYVAQDDLLLEDLTVYQNLYYNAKLCFDNLSEKEIDERVMTTLRNLGLDHIKGLKVGNVLNKKISGGQRKRLNIALELIREPAVMFVDEPTSGLSSKDSQNVIDLLKELSLKGKLIYVVIHQPSSDIYKTFDKMIILDKGGYLTFYGNPIEAILYFKRQTNQADSEKWSENPEEMFNLIEKQIVNEFGRETGRRQVRPDEWAERYKSEYQFEETEEVKDLPPSSLNRPSVFKQAVLFTIRDFLSKVSNQQYMLINLLEAPVLALLLSFIIRFQNEPKTGDYVFRYNDNIPAYILICIIISLFMGLTVSAEEIIKDRKIQKREKFLNLSRFGYLTSKIIILFLLSAIQTFSFVIIGNAILEIQGELFSYWGILFAVSCFANVIGLNISSTFNSVITIYITIPLLLIPQMILSGIIFRYEKMNTLISDKGTVPLVADIMVSRWAFEAIMVDSYMYNKYQKEYYKQDKKEQINNYYSTYWVAELKKRLDASLGNVSIEEKNKKKKDSINDVLRDDLNLLKREIKFYKGLTKKTYNKTLKDFNLDKELSLSSFDSTAYNKVASYLDKVTKVFQKRANDASFKREDIAEALKKHRKGYDISDEKNKYFNESLSNFVSIGANPTEIVIEQDGRLLAMNNQIFREPSMQKRSFVDYRTHFFAPKKPFAGVLFSTYYFNMSVIWIFTLVFFITLYFDFFKNAINIFSKISKRKT